MLFRYGEAIDQEMTATEETVCYSSSQEEGTRDTMQGTRGSIRVAQEAKGARAECEKEALLWFCGKEWVRRGGKQALGCGAALSGLAPGLG